MFKKSLLTVVTCYWLIQSGVPPEAASLPTKLDLAVAGSADQILYNADSSDTRSGQQVWQSVATGDINGDGVKDMLVGAPYAQGPDNRRQLSGEVLIFFGRVGADSMTTVRDAARPSPPQGTGADVIVYGPTRSTFGYSLACADFNGDRIDDMLVGAFTATKPAVGGSQQAPLAGAAYVIFGSRVLSSGARVDLDQSNAARASVRIYGAHAASLTGYAVAAGDVNGDGTADAIIGAPGANKAGVAQAFGAAYVILGGHSLSSVIDLAVSPGAAGGPSVVMLGAEASTRTVGDQLGAALATGDINGDGIDDLIVSAPLADGPQNQRRDAGEVYLLAGSTNLSAGAMFDLATTSPAVVISGAGADDQIGLSLASGDINGDAISDLIIGAPVKDGAAGDDAGAVYVVFGGRELLAGSTRDLRSSMGGYDLFITGPSRRSTFGQAVAAGDINGDRIADLIIAADGATNENNVTSGIVTIIFGRASSATASNRLSHAQPPGPDVTVLGVDEGDRLGFALATGDVNGDGIADLLMAAPGGDGPTNNRSNCGETYVVFGEQ